MIDEYLTLDECMALAEQVEEWKLSFSRGGDESQDYQGNLGQLNIHMDRTPEDGSTNYSIEVCYVTSVGTLHIEVNDGVLDLESGLLGPSSSSGVILARHSASSDENTIQRLCGYLEDQCEQKGVPTHNGTLRLREKAPDQLEEGLRVASRYLNKLT